MLALVTTLLVALVVVPTVTRRRSRIRRLAWLAFSGLGLIFLGFGNVGEGAMRLLLPPVVIAAGVFLLVFGRVGANSRRTCERCRWW